MQRAANVLRMFAITSIPSLKLELPCNVLRMLYERCRDMPGKFFSLEKS